LPKPAPGLELGTWNPSMPCGPRQRDDDTADLHGSMFATAGGAASNPIAIPAAATTGVAAAKSFNFMVFNLSECYGLLPTA